MKYTRSYATVLVLAGLLAAAPADAQRDHPRGPGGPPREEAAATLEVPTEPSIAWFGTWEAGLAEAKRTDRPILLMSAAPQCHGVPGMW